MEERLQKIIARAGIASRRAAEELILAGRVRVNGRIVTELGHKADRQKDRIEVDGKRVVSEAPIYVAFHKPRNVVSTLRDPEGRPTVADYVRGAGARLYPVGRLDFATSGILLMTNDGDFANALLHPRSGVPKTYVLKVQGLMTEDDLKPWREGIRLEDGMTLPAEARLLRHEGDKTWLEVTLREGRNQQIRRMGEATGWPVMRLARTSFAGITSESLRPGEWRALTVDELLQLRKTFGVPKRIRGAVLGASSGPVDHRRAASLARASAKAPPHRSASQGAGPGARSRTSAPPNVRSRANAAAPSAPGRGSAKPSARSRADAAAPSAPGRGSAKPSARSRADATAPSAPLPRPARSARNARSGTKPRGAETRAPRARGPGRR